MSKLKTENFIVQSALAKEDKYELGRFLQRTSAKTDSLIVGVWIETAETIGQVYFKQPWRTSSALGHYQGPIADWMRSGKRDVKDWSWLYHE